MTKYENLAVVSILLLAVGLISISGTTHVLIADQKGEVCILFSSGNANGYAQQDQRPYVNAKKVETWLSKEVDTVVIAGDTASGKKRRQTSE